MYELLDKRIGMTWKRKRAAIAAARRAGAAAVVETRETRVGRTVCAVSAGCTAFPPATRQGVAPPLRVGGRYPPRPCSRDDRARHR